jgi:hypothetical protein
VSIGSCPEAIDDKESRAAILDLASAPSVGEFVNEEEFDCGEAPFER